MPEDVPVQTSERYISPASVEHMSTEHYAGFLTALSVDNTQTDYARLLQVLPVIAQRFGTDIAACVNSGDPLQSFAAQEIAGSTDRILWRLATSQADEEGVRVDPAILRQFYDYIHHPTYWVRRDAIEQISNIVFLDNRNKGEQHLGILRMFEDDLISRLRDVENRYEGVQDLKITDNMVIVLHADFHEYFPQFCVNALSHAQTQAEAQRMVSFFARHTKIERVRQVLQEHTASHPEFRTQFEKLEGWLGYVPSDTALAKVDEVYRKIKFEQYKPNEALIDYEGALLYILIHHKLPDERFMASLSSDDRTGLERLLAQIKNEQPLVADKRVLDIGYGTGRHMKRLMEMGIPVVGIDAVQRHAEVTQSELTNAGLVDEQKGAPIVVGSWHRMPFVDESFSDIYCLGRSELHNATVPQAMKFFAEARRVLKEGGYFYIDIPDPDKGDYTYQRERYQKIAEEQGIDYYEDGAIVDSPDGIHYFDRLAPMKDQFIAWAFVNGFDAELLEAKDYEGGEGRMNTNWYWRLRKRTKEENKKISPDEFQHHLQHISTAGSHMDIGRLFDWR